MGLLTRLEQRATIENPNVPLTDDSGWLSHVLGGGTTKSGVQVNPETATTISAVYAAVRIVAETLAMLPVHLYRRRDDGGRDREDGHPVAEVLGVQPNPEMSGYTLRETIQGHTMLWGNGYQEIVRDGAGRVRELWPMPPDRVQVTRDRAGRLQYVLTLPDRLGGGVKVLRSEDILHVRAIGSSGTVGKSPVTQAREALGLSKAAEVYGAAFFGNGSRPDGVLIHPAELSDTAAARIKKSWEDAHRGLDNAHRVAILEEGMDWKQVGMSARDSQFLETRKFQISEIARIFRVPPHMLADLDRATFSNIEHQSIQFVVHTMQPWLTRWEQEMARMLLTEQERKNLFIKFNLNALLRGDITSRYAAYAVGRQWGWFSANDVLRLEDMNPIGPDGDVYLSPGNMIPADQIDEMLGQAMAGGGSDNGGDPEAARAMAAEVERRKVEKRRTRSLDNRERLSNTYRDLIRDASQAIVNREVNAARRNIEKLEEWVAGDFYDEHARYIRERLLPLLRAYFEAIQREVADEIGGDIGLTPGMERDLEAYVAAMAVRHTRLSQNQLRDLLKQFPEPEEQRAAVEQRLDEWRERRAAKIAQHESVRGGGAFAKIAYLAMGATTLRWVARGSENCPYCRKLDGKIVSGEEPFAGEGDVLAGNEEGQEMRVKSKVGHPPLHNGCDCQIVSGDA